MYTHAIQLIQDTPFTCYIYHSSLPGLKSSRKVHSQLDIFSLFSNSTPKQPSKIYKVNCIQFKQPKAVTTRDCRVLARISRMPVQNSNFKISARPDLAINLLQILIPATINSLVCQKGQFTLQLCPRRWFVTKIFG